MDQALLANLEDVCLMCENKKEINEKYFKRLIAMK